MSSMPQGNEPGQWGSSQQQGTMPGQEGQGQATGGGIPGQQGTYQGQQGQQGSYQGQQGQQGQQPGRPVGEQWSDRSGRVSPVDQAETRVTGRRVVQYLIDSFLVWIVPGLVSIPFDRSSSTFLHIIGGVVFFALFVLIGVWYWVIRPHSHHGQTFGMQLLGLRVISKSGGPANMTQLFVRWICLIFDAIPYGWPFGGMVGFVVIICSRYRQRIGDHLARTLVISTGMLQDRQHDYADAGQPGVGQRLG